MYGISFFFWIREKVHGSFMISPKWLLASAWIATVNESWPRHLTANAYPIILLGKRGSECKNW